MKIQEAILTNKYVKRKAWDDSFCYHPAGTGPYTDVTSSVDYFTFLEDGMLIFSTSAPDLYAEDLLADDYELVEVSNEELTAAMENTKNLED